jgi:uncharacterized protein (TIGR00661 family)
MPRRKTILVAPLNWGLGHASRCIPLIHEILDQDLDVLIASDGAALEFLKKELPQLPSVELPSYSIKYPRKGHYLKWALLKRVPKILKAVEEEKKRVKDLVDSGTIQGIISDNRWGVYNDSIPSVYITHQLTVLSGITTTITSKIHQRIIERFDECWVPDYSGTNNLSGDLGYINNPNFTIIYLGALSRMRKLDLPIQIDILFLLSGPEPQRSILEGIILDQFKELDRSIVLVRGVLESQQTKIRIGKIDVINYVLKNELEEILNTSGLVVSRPGYTTLMDLSILEKKAFFIPTPGQYEQVYLAKRLKELELAPFCEQDDFSIESLQEVVNFKGLKGDSQPIDYKDLFSLFNGK